MDVKKVLSLEDWNLHVVAFKSQQNLNCMQYLKHNKLSKEDIPLNEAYHCLCPWGKSGDNIEQMKLMIDFAINHPRMNYKEVHKTYKNQRLIYMSYNSFKDIMSSHLNDLGKKPSRGCAQILINISKGVSPYQTTKCYLSNKVKGELYLKFKNASTENKKRLMKIHKLNRSNFFSYKKFANITILPEENIDSDDSYE